MRIAPVGSSLLPLLALVALVGGGCGSHSLPVGAPISTPSGAWSWVDFPDSTCDEGTPTGLVVNFNGSKNLMLFFNGGGACWDATTCLALNTSTHGPITRADFDAGKFAFGGSILDRQLPGNPFGDWNMVFVPYCTGDLHIGNNDASYTYNSTTKTFHHKGRANVQAFLARIAATVPKPEQVLVAGSSAGGYGATLNYDLIRSYFPSAKVFLLDDSGPLLKGDVITPNLRAVWASAWKYGPVLDAINPAIENDFSVLYTALAGKYPQDRMALLSYSQDQVIRSYLGLSATGFQSALDDLDSTVLSPQAHAHFYVVTGTSHTMLGNPAGTSSTGVALLDWLGQMESASDGAWTSVHP